MRIDLIGQKHSHRSRAVDSQECVNFYTEFESAGASKRSCLIGTPGLSEFVDTGISGGCRALYVINAGTRLFAIMSNRLIEILDNGTIAERGWINTTSGLVSMADNGRQLIISDGNAGYIYNLMSWRDGIINKEYYDGKFSVIENGTKGLTYTSTGEKVLIESEFPAGSHVAFVDGYFLANKEGSGAFFVSEYYNGEIWDVTEYAVTETMPDNVLSIVKFRNEIWFFGNRSIEIWYNSGQLFPFTRVSGAHIDVGTSARWSVAQNGNAIFWLGANMGGNDAVWMATGMTPIRISTHAVEYVISSITRTDDAIGYCYQQEGHSFYVLTFPTGNKTLVYDMLTGLWHERGEWKAEYGKYFRHPSVAACCFNRKILVGCYNSSKIYELSLNVHTDDGEPIRSMITLPTMQTNRLTRYRTLEVLLEKGTALNRLRDYDEADPSQTGIIQYDVGSDPQLLLQWSEDGGYTWSNELWGVIGRIGQYRHRVRYYNLGAGYNRVFRLIHVDPVPRVLTAVELELE